MIKYKESADFWYDLISEALDFRKTFGREKQWSGLEAMQQNLPNSGADKGPNIIQEMSEALDARLNVSRPVISVDPSPMSPESSESAMTVQALDNWLLKELGISASVSLAVLHAFLWGRGIIKLGYDSEWGYEKKFDLGTIKAPMGMTMTQFSKKGKRLEFGAGRPGMPWASVVLPHDFVVPWGTGALLDQAPWCAHRVVRHIDLLRADPKYDKTERLEPTLSQRDVMDSYRKTQHPIRTSMMSMGRGGAGGQSEYVELWEIRNRISGRMITISEKLVHRAVPDLLQIEGFPFAAITMVPHPRSFWGTPQAEYLRLHQAEQNDIALVASMQRRVNVLKFLVKDGAMEVSELERALSPNVGIAAMVKTGQNLKDVIQLMPQGVNYPLYQDAEFSRRNARQAVGFSPNQLGEYDASSRRTASEAMIVERGSNQRSDRRQDRVATFYTEIMRKINQIIFTFWRTPRFIQVGPNEWPSFTGQQIEGEYEYSMEFGEDRPRKPDEKRQLAFQMYIALRDDPLVDPVELRNYLSESFNSVRFGKIFKNAENANIQLQMSQMQEAAGASRLPSKQQERSAV